jgi:hypothetical protein
LGGEEVFRQLGGEGVEGRGGRGEEVGDELFLGEGGEAMAFEGVGAGGLGFGVEAVGATAGKVEELGLVVGAAEAGEFGQDFAEALPAVLGVGRAVEEVAGGQDEAGGEQGGEFVGEGGAWGVRAEGVGVFGELSDGEAGLLEVLPIEEAALFPLGEVRLVDGLGMEVASEDGPDLG